MAKRIVTVEIRVVDGTSEKVAARMRDSLNKIEENTRKLGNSFDKATETTMRRLNQIQQALKGIDFSSIYEKITRLIQLSGAGFSVYSIVKYGFEINALKNQLTAFEGTSIKAEKRLQSLRNLVDQSAGATREMAYAVYSLLKPLKTVSDETINKTITSLGRLKLAFKNMIPTDFAYNLTQIFGQDFEEQDIKQAIGQVPNFRQYLVKAFGTGNNELLREMKKAGKITMDSFFQGIADVVQNDSVLQELQEPIALRLQKFIERAFEAVEPIANKIVGILALSLEAASLYLQNFAQLFSAISNNTGTVFTLVSALGLLAIAYNAVAVAAGISGIITAFSSGLGGTVFVIQNVIRAMFALQTAFITTGEVAIAATGGWLGLVAILGVAIYALIQYNQAVQKTTEDHQKGLDVLKSQIETLDQQKTSLDAVKTNTTVFAAKQQELVGIYGTLNSSSKTRVDQLTLEKGATEALREEIEKLKQAKLDELTARLVSLANDTAAAFQKKQQAEASAKAAEDNYKSILQSQTITNIRADRFGNVSVDTRKATSGDLEILRKAWEDAEAAAGKANTTFQQNASVLQNGAQIRGLTIQQILDYSANTNQAKGFTDDFRTSVIGATNSQNTLANGLNNTSSATKDLTSSVFDLRMELNKLTSFDQGKIDRSIYDIVRLTTNKAEAEALARKTLQNSPDLKKMIDDNKNANDRMKAVQDIFSPSDGSGGSSRRARTPNPAADFRRENRVISGNAQWDKFVYEAAAKFGIDPLLVFAQMNQESSFKRTAMSNKGASGLMQLMPGTARDLGVTNIFDPKQNIFAGVKYLREQLNTFGGNTALALAAYNAGPGAVQKYGGIPPYKETQDYVKRISDRYQKLKGGRFELGSNFDLERSLADQSDKITKEQRDAEILKAIEAARTTRIRPDDEIIREYNRLQVEEARRSGTLQPKMEQTLAEFKGFREIGAGLSLEKEKSVNDLIRERLNLDEREEDYLTRRLNFGAEVAAVQEDYNLSLKESQLDLDIETALLSKRNLELETSVEFGKQQNAQYREIMDTQIALDVLRRQNADASFVAERQRLAAAREQLSLEQEITALQDEIANAGINDALKIRAAYLQDIVDLREREVDAVIAVNRAELELSRSMEISNNQIRARVYEHLAQQKTLNESIADGIINTYEAVADRASSALDKLNEKTRGFLSFIIEPAKAVQRNFLTNITRGIVDAIFPGAGSELTKTNNPIARPIVDEQQKTNKILERIAGALGAGRGFSIGPVSAGASGGRINLGTIFGGSAGGGIFNFAGAGGNGSRTGDVVDGITQIFAGDKGRGDLWSNIKHLFSTRDGGIFGPRKNILTGNTSRLAGILGGAGDLASMAGGLIGGRFGGVLSMAGSGMSIGSMFGPWGAAIGAGVGALLGLFGGDPKRKEDKKQNLPALRQGFVDSIKEFQQLIKDLDGAQINASDAIKRGDEIRTAIASGFNIDFKSKKYRKIAQNEIRKQLAEIDRVPGGLMEQLRQAADRRRQAEEFSNRFVATFATGVFMDKSFAAQYGEFKRRNGVVTGGIAGKDSVRALLMPNEIVANEAQQERIRRAAGFDVFAYAGIPNYPKKPVRRFAEGGFIGASSSGTTGAIGGGPVVIEELHLHLSNKVGISESQAAEITNVGLKASGNQEVVVKTVRTHVNEAPPSSDGLARDLKKQENN